LPQVEEGAVIRLLEEIAGRSEEGKAAKKITVQRKKRVDDEDEDDDF
jgi:hypothetical protein